MDGVTLSPALMTALFAEVLVRIPGAVDPVPVNPKTAAPRAPLPDAEPPLPISLGENRRKICLLVSVPGKELLPAGSRVFLEKILSACQLGIADLAIVNVQLSPVPVSVLQTRFSPGKWLLAGLSPASLGMEGTADRPFELQSWQGAQVMTLPALAELDGDTAAARTLKRQLWAGLQTLFGL